MSLYSYAKAPPSKVSHKNLYRSRSVVLRLQEEPTTLWGVFEGLKNDLADLMSSSKFIGTLVPAILILYGSNLLLNQLVPAAAHMLQGDNIAQDIISLVPSDFVLAKQTYLSDPGSNYFAQIQNSAYQARILMDDPVSASYKGRFEISIPSLKLINLPVEANVNSGIESLYDAVLLRGLAHMESTGLPISSIKNNIVIYGHSAGGDYYKRTGDVAAAFTILPNIKLGDEIDMKINGKFLKYKVSKTKIVAPNDISIIAGEAKSNVQPLTLFTCHPPGNNSKRFIVTALPIALN